MNLIFLAAALCCYAGSLYNAEFFSVSLQQINFQSYSQAAHVSKKPARASPAGLLGIAGIPVPVLTGADGETRTRTAFATTPSR